MLGDVLTSSTADGGSAAVVQTERGVLWIEVPRFKHHRAELLGQRPPGVWSEPPNDLALVLLEQAEAAFEALETGMAADVLEAVSLSLIPWVLSGAFAVEDC